MNASLVGSQLGKYQILAEIGRGGMGIVYKGYDSALDRYVAIKVLAPHLVWEKEFVERFLREARAAARLKHPGIVTIYDVGQEGGWYYYVMEYLEGQTLTTLIHQQGTLPPEWVISILRPLADALDTAHHSGLVHRDIKPGNILIDQAGRVTLTDFGIARAVQETRLTSTGATLGTPEYMSPEQVRGLAADARSDQYSLAVVTYEMLSGRVPFQADSILTLMYKVAHEALPPIRCLRPELPARVEEVLARALAKEPGDRYPTATAFVEALEEALAVRKARRTPVKPIVQPAEPLPEVRQPEAHAIKSTVTPVGVTLAATPDAVAPLGQGQTLPLQAAPVATPAMETAPGLAPTEPLMAEKPFLRRGKGWGWILGLLAVIGMIGGLVWQQQARQQQMTNWQATLSAQALATATVQARAIATPDIQIPTNTLITTTITVANSSKALFFEDFTTSEILAKYNVDVVGPWKVENSKYVIQLDEPDLPWAATFIYPASRELSEWTDYSVEADVMCTGNDREFFAGIGLRHGSEIGYGLELHWNANFVGLYTNEHQVLKSVEYPLVLGRWYHIKLKGTGNHLWGYINGQTLIDFIDKRDLRQPYGGVPLTVYSGQLVRCEFDNVKVEESSP